MAKKSDIKMGGEAEVSREGKDQADLNVAPVESAEIPAGVGVPPEADPGRMERLKADAGVIENPPGILGDIPAGGPLDPDPDVDKLREEGRVETHHQAGDRNPKDFPHEEAPKLTADGKPTKYVNHARVPAPLKERKKDSVRDLVGFEWLARWLQKFASGREDYVDFSVWRIDPCLVNPRVNGDGCCRVEKHRGGDAVWYCHHSGAQRLLREPQDLPTRNE